MLWAVCVVIGLVNPPAELPNSVTLELVPNPDKLPSVLEGKGRITLKDEFVGVVFVGSLVGADQFAKIPGVFDPKTGTWTASLFVAAGDYECWAILTTKDANGKRTESKSKIVKCKLR